MTEWLIVPQSHCTKIARYMRFITNRLSKFCLHSVIFTEIWLSVHFVTIVEYPSTFECAFRDTNTDQFRLY